MERTRGDKALASRLENLLLAPMIDVLHRDIWFCLSLVFATDIIVIIIIIMDSCSSSSLLLFMKPKSIKQIHCS